MDLNLVRRMVATQSGPQRIAFYVCNTPGPETASQREVDEVIHTGLSDQKQVACVAMEWSTSPGVNGGKPFTKFLTFGPDGHLLPSINLDGRGEKYLPGACVACHGGTQYNGRFAARGLASPYLGAGFLPFDTGNYLFGSAGGLSEAEQSQAIHDLNMLVKATDNRGYPSTSRLIDGWYHNDTTIALDKQYVPDEWKALDASKPGAAKFYREVVGGVCRTCHIALGSQRFDWDVNPTVRFTGQPGTVNTHFCGGSADVAVNASMPNALMSRDRLADRMQADPELASLMQTFLGCVAPKADPGYAKR
jgi:mono/diheme cytochrome c family protein